MPRYGWFGMSPTTGSQTVVATLPRQIVPDRCLDDYLVDKQAVVVADTMYLLEGPDSAFGGPYSYLVQVDLGS